MIRSVAAPTLVIDGEASPPVIRTTAESLVRTLPDAPRRTLAGEGHDLAPDALRPVLLEFLA